MRPEIEELIGKYPVASFKKKKIVIEPDQPLTHAYYLKSGYIKMYSVSPEGIETTIHIFKPHSYIPMISILGDISNRYYFETITPIEVVLIPRQIMSQFLSQHPDILFDFTKRILQGLDKMAMRIELLSSERAHMRVISALFFLAHHFGREEKEYTVIDSIFTHQDIASLAGLTRETTSREWKKLEKEKIVIYDGRKITIDMKLLRKVPSATITV